MDMYKILSNDVVIAADQDGIVTGNIDFKNNYNGFLAFDTTKVFSNVVFI